MEENTNEVQEVEAEVSEEDLDIFDDSWDEDNDDVDTSDNGEDTDGEEADGEPEEPEEPEEQEETEDSEEPGTETETENQRFTIKYNGNDEEYDLEQMTTLAQKGRNYDHIKGENESLKAESGKYKNFLQKLADRAGVSIEEQIDLTEAMWLMDEEAEKGNSITEAEALLRVQRARNVEPEQEAQPEIDSDEVINRFLAVYPNVQATDIPKEVFDEARRIGDLLGAYQAWEIKRLKEENEKTKQSVQNEQNARRSTGPRKTSGTKHQIDDFDAGWDSE